MALRFYKPKAIREPRLIGETSSLRPNQRLIMTLLRDGADPNITNDLGTTALMMAASLGHQEIMRLLLRYGADVNAADVNGQTALMLAIARQKRPIVTELLSTPTIDVTKETTKGMTALRWAVELSDASVVEQLIKLGADPKHLDAYGDTPLGAAERAQRPEIIRALTTPE